MSQHNGKTQCCPKFEPELWDGKELIWNKKRFLKDTMPQFLHMPLPGVFGKKVSKMWGRIEDANARTDDKDFLMLAAESSPWKGELYINTTKEVPGEGNTTLSGDFMTKVFDGGYNEIPKWVAEMEKYLEQKGKKANKYYFYYTTCPKCAKIYGHNYVVLFAQVSDS